LSGAGGDEERAGLCLGFVAEIESYELVGMVLEGDLLVRLLDLGCRAARIKAEDFVVGLGWSRGDL